MSNTEFRMSKERGVGGLLWRDLETCAKAAYLTEGSMVPAEEKEGRRFDLEDRLINFAVRVVNLVEALPSTRAGNHVAGQLIRCGTSPAPNYGEAQSAESRNDFIHKMRVCLKELRETRIWLLICERKPLVEPAEKASSLLAECNELIAIFVSSIGTAERNKDK